MDSKALGRTEFLLGASTMVVAATASAAADPMTVGKVHRLSISISQSDAATMNLALNNAANATSYYEDQGQQLLVEIVAYGPGLTMYRADTSPVKARLAEIAQGFPNMTFSACDNTIKSMEKAEGKKIVLVPQAHIVPAGVVRLVELQEKGWSYIRP